MAAHEVAMGFFAISARQGDLDLLPNDPALERGDCEQRQDTDYRNDHHHFNHGEAVLLACR